MHAHADKTASRHNAQTDVPLEITVVYDNFAYRDDLDTAWGFSCVIKGLEKTILFDTGGDGKLLMANLKKLGVKPREIDAVFISHDHWDHTGGLEALLKGIKRKKLTVYLPQAATEASETIAKDLGADVIRVSTPQQICANAQSTGQMPGAMDEHALIIRTDRGLVVITGCAHPGIVHMLEKAMEQTQQSILCAMGGFHLKDSSKREIRNVIQRFRELAIHHAAPSHCTGVVAKTFFEKECQDHYVNIGAGRTVTMHDLP